MSRSREIRLALTALGLMVIVCLIGCGAAENPAPYLKDLRGPNPYARQRAAKVLGDMKEPMAVKPLLELLTPNQPEDVRVEAIAALGKIEDHAATPRLIDELNSGSRRVRKFAAEALGRIRDRRAVVPLIDFIKGSPDPTDKDVLIAIWALGNIGDISAMDVLMKLRESPDKYVSYNANQALKRLGQ